MNLLKLKTNVFGTAAIAMLSAVTTALLFQGFSAEPNSLRSAPLAVGASSIETGPDVLACGDKVYSPVQRRCVDQATFDAEMKRLFAALGLDAGIYASHAAPDAGAE